MNYQNIIINEPVNYFRKVALEAMRGRWKLVLGVGFLYCILTMLPVAIFDPLFGIVLDAERLAGLLGSSADIAAVEAVYGNDFKIVMPSIVGAAYNLLTSGAFTLGITIFLIHIVRRAEADAGMVFAGFGNYFKSLGLMILIGLICMAVVIVGVIIITLSSYAGVIAFLVVIIVFPLMFVAIAVIMLTFSMSYYILADNPQMGVISCMKWSRYIMQGNKGKLFFLYLSFIGWFIIYNLYLMLVTSLTVGSFSASASTELIPSIITAIFNAAGFGVLFVYLYTSEAAFYERASGISSGMFNSLSGHFPIDTKDE